MERCGLRRAGTGLEKIRLSGSGGGAERSRSLPFPCPVPIRFPFPSLSPLLPFPKSSYELTAGSGAEPPAEIEFCAFLVKNLASGENNILVTFMENYIDFPCLCQHSPKIFLEHLLQRIYSVDARV